MAPAFTGLGAPYGSRTRSALDSACFRIGEPVAAVRTDGAAPESLRIDGGMARNRRFRRRLADLLGLSVEVSAEPEATALGAAHPARCGGGVAEGAAPAAESWRAETRLELRLDGARREEERALWADAVSRVRAAAPHSSSFG